MAPGSSAGSNSSGSRSRSSTVMSMTGLAMGRTFLRVRIRCGEINSMCILDGTERGEGAGEDADPAGYLLRRGIFVRTMANPAAAGDEEHGDRCKARHEQRVVVG